ncbi:MAG TPA: GntR family transcriptional regulator [Candidatus Baltobacteraceae bacterium]|nr:GntR family transcriptional regulator [Candidatus Baltobacteraceae bacterium]
MRAPLRWGSRHDDVLDAIRAAIVSCEIAPGSRLVQDELAARFGVSRIPLREALRTLEAEGLVLSEPNRGAVCRPLEPKDIADLYDVRLALESLACRTAADRFADLRGATAQKRSSAESAIARHDLATLIDRDCAFHAGIAEATGNAHLAESLAASWSQIMRAMHYFFTIERYPENVWIEHEAIARAIAVGDAERAVGAMQTHILSSRSAILRGLKEAYR